MATLYQRSGQYYLNYSINGKRVRKSIGTDKHEAEILLKELRYKLFKGDIQPNRPEFPVLFFFKKYLENCHSRLSEGTYIRYNNAIKHLKRFFTKQHPVQYISQINKGALQSYILFRQDNKPTPRSKTINIELTVIRAALTWAVDNDWLSTNPASRLKLLKTSDSKKGRALTEDEVNSLLRGCETLRDGLWFKDILVTFLNTGMRRGELLNLTWDDIDWDQNLIKIQNKPFWSPKSYERTIPINQIVLTILNSLQAHSNRPFVFTKRNKKIKDNVLRKKLVTLSKRVGLPHLTRIHDFRHTFASNLLMAGVDIPTVQALLGHKSWNTTMIYSHQTKEHTKNAVDKLVLNNH